MAATIYWAGDSTVKQNDFSTYPQTGIGQGMSLYLKKEIRILNYAENGRSTKSFLEEGLFLPIEQRIHEGDFLFIQFGHNDEKPDPSRHTDPYTTYQENLLYMIRTAQRHNARPVLITPLYRRLFDENGILIEHTHLDYPDAMKALAQSYSIPCIDLCEASRQLLIKTGNEASKRWFMYFDASIYKNYPDGSRDNTHLVYDGAVTMAGLIADSLQGLGDMYQSLLLDPGKQLSQKDQNYLAEEIQSK